MKKECRKFLKILNRLRDGEAPPGEEAVLKGHMEECPACREEAEALEQITLYFQKGERLSASSGFTERILLGLEKELRLNSFTPWSAAIPLIQKLAVAAVVVMMISLSSSLPRRCTTCQ